DNVALLQPSSDVSAGRIGGSPGGSPEQEPVASGAFKQRHVVTIPTPCKPQGMVQALELAAKKDGHTGFAHAVEADLLPASRQGFGQSDLHRKVAPFPTFLRVRSEEHTSEL